LRKLGQYAGKARRMASDLRAQSGIDDVLRGEGIADDIAEIRKLARGELDAVRSAADLRAPLASAAAAVHDPDAPKAMAAQEIPIDRQREYPREGGDSYRALPDTAIVYAETLPKSKLAEDPLYVAGETSS